MGGLSRAKLWLEVIGAAIAIAVPVVTISVLLLAAFGPFEMARDHEADIVRVDSTAAAAQAFRSDTRTVVFRLYCDRQADHGQVPAGFCAEAFPVDLDQLLRASK